MIYVIHFDQPLAHANHYIGYCEDGRLDERIARHRAGNGAKILAALNRLDITYRIVHTLPGTRDDERRIKNRKNAKRLCPICHPKKFRKHEQ